MKKVAILGFGMEGKDATRYFLDKDAQISVFDKKTKEEIAQDDWLKENITWICGENYLNNGLCGFDTIVRSPGFYRYHPAIIEAEKAGTNIINNTIIFFQSAKAPIIGVTGTKGKGTTSTLIYKALEKAGKKVLLAGNIGEPMLSLLPKTQGADWVVLELSSFQIIDLPVSPKIVVVTNITSDHMDWHKDQEEYEKAKENLWIRQNPDDFLVLNYDDPTSFKLSKNAPGNVYFYSLKERTFASLDKKENIWVDNNKLGNIKDIKLIGPHNQYNALAAIATTKLADVDMQKAWKAIKEFEGLEHRLEKVAEIDGVIYVNDSFATNPEPTLAAIKSFDQPKILILGGHSKGADFTHMADEITITKSNVRSVVLIGDEAQNINNALAKAGFKGYVKTGYTKMIDIVNAARELAQKGDIVLLSPACASFGLFKDYKDRGKQFKEEILGKGRPDVST